MADSAGADAPIADIDEARIQRVGKAVAEWKGQLVDLGGRNTLLYYKDLRQGTLDLRAEGSADLAVRRILASHTLRLSDVFSGDALGPAAKRARTVSAKAQENFEERGLQTLFLAWGMATWTNHIGTATPAAPVLLRQARLTARGGGGEDFDVSLPGELEVNPTLLHFLETEFKLRILPEELLDLVGEVDSGLPDAAPAFERLVKLAGDVTGFDLAERVLLGNFSYAKLPMVNDLEAALLNGQLASNDLLVAISGDPSAAEAVRLRHPGVTSDEPDRTPPADEFLVLDADASQSYAINTALRGGDLVIEGPPGTGKSQTIANLIASLAAHGRRTLFVAEKRAAIDAVLERLAALGLGDLVLDLHDGVSSRRRIAQDLARALASAGTTPLTTHTDNHGRLERRREQLRAWREALHRPREPWGVSVYDMQAELVELRRATTASHRLDRDAVGGLGADAFSAASVEFEDFAERGGFALVTGKSPWRRAFEGRLVTSTDQVHDAKTALSSLSERSLPQAADELRRVADACGLRCPGTLAEAAYLLSAVEDAAGLAADYDAAIFDEGAALVDDLAPANRRAVGRAAARLGNVRYRLARRRVNELGRGRRASGRDARVAASAAADVRRRWDALSADGASPVASVETDHARGLVSQLGDELTAVSRLTDGSAISSESEITALAAKIRRLLDDQATLVKLPDLTRLATSLVSRGLWPLVVEAAERGLDAGASVRLLRYVWLESVLDAVALSDPVVGGFDREAHDRAVAEFQGADIAHLQSTPDRVRRAVAERVVCCRDEHREQSQLVQAEAAKKQRHLPLRELVQAAPDVLTALKPCWAMSPLVVAQVLPSERLFDVVIFDEASQVTPADAVGALLRADRAVVAGDSKQLPPTSFFAAASGGGEDDEAVEQELYRTAGVALTRDIESILEVMRALLPPPVGTKTLGWHYRSRDERLIAFSNAQESLYDWSLTTFPGTGIDECISHELVPWMPGRVGQEDSVSDEVERVVELIVNHAEERPEESLGVIAMGLKHANRIVERLRQVRLSRPDLDELFERGPDGRSRPEPLFIKNLERVQGDERDSIILTIGYGKSAEGKMLYRFGPLNNEGGERRLNVAITRARSRITLVSSFGSSDLDPNRLGKEGAQMLCRYLQYAESGGRHLGDQAKAKPDLNPFERDVRDALVGAGLPMVAQYGCSGFWIDFAAQHPTQPGRMVLAIEADGATYHAGETARDRDRLRQDHLERLGWTFHRIWSTDWFHHRDAEIERAVRAWRSAVEKCDERGPTRRVRPGPQATPATAAPGRAGAKPRFRAGLPIGEYPRSTLRALAHWIESDTLLRTEDEVLAEMMSELGFRRRGKNIVDALSFAIRESRQARR